MMHGLCRFFQAMVWMEMTGGWTRLFTKIVKKYGQTYISCLPFKTSLNEMLSQYELNLSIVTANLMCNMLYCNMYKS